MLIHDGRTEELEWMALKTVVSVLKISQVSKCYHYLNSRTRPFHYHFVFNQG